MRTFITTAFFLLTTAGYGQNLVVDSSSVNFRIRNAGIQVNGSFSGMEAKLDFNPRQLTNSRITASVDAATIETGIRIRNNHLRRKDYFYVDSFPRINMESVRFQQKGEGQFIGDFILHLKGSEGKVTVPFTFQHKGNIVIFKGNFDINRKDYDIGGNSLILADMVHITILVIARESGR